MRLNGDAQRKHWLVGEGGEWTGRVDSTRWYTYWNLKSKKADKKNAELENPRAWWCAGTLDQKREQLPRQYDISIE